MRKRVWIMNHYVMNQYFNRGGRHYWIAEQLKQDGFEPVVACGAKPLRCAVCADPFYSL